MPTWTAQASSRLSWQARPTGAIFGSGPSWAITLKRLVMRSMACQAGYMQTAWIRSREPSGHIYSCQVYRCSSHGVWHDDRAPRPSNRTIASDLTAARARKAPNSMMLHGTLFWTCTRIISIHLVVETLLDFCTVARCCMCSNNSLLLVPPLPHAAIYLVISTSLPLAWL